MWKLVLICTSDNDGFVLIVIFLFDVTAVINRLMDPSIDQSIDKSKCHHVNLRHAIHNINMATCSYILSTPLICIYLYIYTYVYNLYDSKKGNLVSQLLPVSCESHVRDDMEAGKDKHILARKDGSFERKWIHINSANISMMEFWQNITSVGI